MHRPTGQEQACREQCDDQGREGEPRQAPAIAGQQPVGCHHEQRNGRGLLGEHRGDPDERQAGGPRPAPRGRALRAREGVHQGHHQQGGQRIGPAVVVLGEGHECDAGPREGRGGPGAQADAEAEDQCGGEEVQDERHRTPDTEEQHRILRLRAHRPRRRRGKGMEQRRVLHHLERRLLGIGVERTAEQQLLHAIHGIQLRPAQIDTQVGHQLQPQPAVAQGKGQQRSQHQALEEEARTGHGRRM